MVTKFCARLNLLNNFDRYITTPRVVLHKRFYIKGQYLTGGANNTVFLKVYNAHETILLPCEELKIYSGNPLLPMCKRHMRHTGPTTRAKARAAGDDDDSNYEGSFSGMQMPHLGRRSGAQSGRISCSSLQDSQPRAQRIDMDMLTQQIGVLCIGHEAMQNTATQTY